MTDQVFIRGLVVYAHHGVGKDERRIGQQFMLDLTLDIDLTSAAASDRLADTVSYAELAEVASRVFAERRCRLVEAAGGAVADAVLAAFPRVARVTVTVHKPHAPIPAVFADVGVTLTRSRKSIVPKSGHRFSENTMLKQTPST